MMCPCVQAYLEALAVVADELENTFEMVCFKLGVRPEDAVEHPPSFSARMSLVGPRIDSGLGPSRRPPSPRPVSANGSRKKKNLKSPTGVWVQPPQG